MRGWLFLFLGAWAFIHVFIGHHDIREQQDENTQAIAELRTDMNIYRDWQVNGKHIVHTPRGDGGYIISICEHTSDGHTVSPPNLDEIELINEMGIKTFEPAVKFSDPTADLVITLPPDYECTPITNSTSVIK